MARFFAVIRHTLPQGNRILRSCSVVLCLYAAACAQTPAPEPEVERPSPSAPAIPRSAPWDGVMPPAGPAESLPPVSLDSTAPVRVGLLLPLSGPRAQTGQAILQAAQLALFEFSDQRLILLPRDTKGTGAGAAAAAQAALQAGAELLLGPVFAEEVASAASVARAAGRNVIAFSSDRRVAGNGVYLLSFSPEQEVERMLNYARAQGLTRFAALIPRTPYGERVAQAYQQNTASHGETAKLVYYLPDTQSMHAPIRQLADYETRHQKLLEEIRRLEQSTEPLAPETLEELKTQDTLGEVDFDALLIAEGGSMLRALAPLLAYYEIDPKKVRYLGTGLWNEPSINQESALIGGWFPASTQKSGANFAARMQAFFDPTPTPVTALGYDAVALAGVLVSQGDAATRFSDTALTNPVGFSGVQGIFRLRPDGLTERGLAVLEIDPAGVRVIDPAPAEFEPALTQ